MRYNRTNRAKLQYLSVPDPVLLGCPALSQDCLFWGVSPPLPPPQWTCPQCLSQQRPELSILLTKPGRAGQVPNHELAVILQMPLRYYVFRDPVTFLKGDAIGSQQALCHPYCGALSWRTVSGTNQVGGRPLLTSHC